MLLLPLVLQVLGAILASNITAVLLAPAISHAVRTLGFRYVRRISATRRYPSRPSVTSPGVFPHGSPVDYRGLEGLGYIKDFPLGHHLLPPYGQGTLAIDISFGSATTLPCPDVSGLLLVFLGVIVGIIAVLKKWGSPRSHIYNHEPASCIYPPAYQSALVPSYEAFVASLVTKDDDAVPNVRSMGGIPASQSASDHSYESFVAGLVKNDNASPNFGSIDSIPKAWVGDNFQDRMSALADSLCRFGVSPPASPAKFPMTSTPISTPVRKTKRETTDRSSHTKKDARNDSPLTLEDLLPSTQSPSRVIKEINNGHVDRGSPTLTRRASDKAYASHADATNANEMTSNRARKKIRTQPGPSMSPLATSTPVSSSRHIRRSILINIQNTASATEYPRYGIRGTTLVVPTHTRGASHHEVDLKHIPERPSSMTPNSRGTPRDSSVGRSRASTISQHCRKGIFAQVSDHKNAQLHHAATNPSRDSHDPPAVPPRIRDKSAHGFSAGHMSPLADPPSSPPVVPMSSLQRRPISSLCSPEEMEAQDVWFTLGLKTPPICETPVC